MNDSLNTETNDGDARFLSKQEIAATLSERDFVMEPEVFSTMMNFLKVDGSPEEVVSLLADNFHGTGQLVNLMGCWLSDLELSPLPSTFSQDCSLEDYLSRASEKLQASETVCHSIESTTSALIAKTFNPAQADKIFESDASERVIDWLPELISHHSWRRLIFELSAQCNTCLMLDFAVKLISDAGYQSEISDVNIAVQQLDIFSRVFLSSFDDLLLRLRQGGIHTQSFNNAFAQLFRFSCHSDQTFLYTQTLLRVISKKESGRIAAVCNRISQMLRLQVEQQEQKVFALCIAMMQSELDRIPQSVISAVLTMIQKNMLNPADISQLYKAYFDPCPPPVDLIHDPLFLDMLVDELFNPSKPAINMEYRPKYIYLLAYAGCVSETTKNGIRVQSKSELETTRRKTEELVSYLHHNTNADLLSLLRKLKPLMELPILASCVLHYIRAILTREDSLSEPQPVHFALIDHAASLHSTLHNRIFDMLRHLYEYQTKCSEVAEVAIGRQRAIIDRFVHLLLCGHTTAVIEHISNMFSKNQTDVSLVRYFCTEVLDVIDVPYTQEFVHAFLPIVKNHEVFDDIILDKSAAAKEFLKICSTVVK